MLYTENPYGNINAVERYVSPAQIKLLVIEPRARPTDRQREGRSRSEMWFRPIGRLRDGIEISTSNR